MNFANPGIGNLEGTCQSFTVEDQQISKFLFSSLEIYGWLLFNDFRI